MKILVFNVKYSENLGDGLLADCIEANLRSDGVDVETFDLAGRTAVGTSKNRGLILKVLQHLPAPVRRAVVSLALQKTLKASRKIWSAKIAEADAVILGGGNLFQDDDLNFPLKVGTLLDCVAEQGKPFAIYAVGVGPHWSAPAKRLFQRLLKTELVHLSVRDGFASANWLRHFPEGPAPQIFSDPGLLAASIALDTLPAAPKSVGLCVTEPKVLARHATKAGDTIPLADIGAYQQLIQPLTENGYRVTLFSNGAGEDQRLAEAVLKSCRAAGIGANGNLRLADQPRNTQQLLTIIKTNSVIVAHRLHACIAAHALQIPAVGLAWDGKVEGFFRSMGRLNYFVNSYVPAQEILEIVMRAEREGISSQIHREQISAARSGLSDLRSILLRNGQSYKDEVGKYATL